MGFLSIESNFVPGGAAVTYGVNPLDPILTHFSPMVGVVAVQSFINYNEWQVLSDMMNENKSPNALDSEYIKKLRDGLKY
ncbi:hypothetical protein [Leptospira noguchii]|nr:hypothetical protein [Leptospira noguchii]